MPALSSAQAKSMLLSVAAAVIAHKEFLCDADRYIGDGDHGIAMASGFEAAAKELEAHEYPDVYQVFSTVGRTMIRVMGGASGIIFGLLFYAGAKNMPSKGQIDEGEFAGIFEKALAEIQAKGQAKPGDKTVVDGLAPMVEAMRVSASGGAAFPAMLRAAYQAAEDGKEASKRYIARLGKAKTLESGVLGIRMLAVFH